MMTLFIIGFYILVIEDVREYVSRKTLISEIGS